MTKYRIECRVLANGNISYGTGLFDYDEAKMISDALNVKNAGITTHRPVKESLCSNGVGTV